MSESPTSPQRGRPRTTGDYTCDRCRRSTGKIRIRWPDGNICGICFHQATRTFGSCAQCGHHRLLPGRDGLRLLCRCCAGITTDLDCHRCGAEGEHHRRGLCTRCTLRDDLTAVLLPTEREPLPGLIKLVEVLVAVERPESIYSWIRRPRVQPLLRGLGDRSINLHHDALDTAPSSQAREHIRELLIAHGLLPWRDPDLARFEAWLRQHLELIEDSAARRPVEQFATWHHLRRIRAKVRRSQDVRGAAQTAKQQIAEASRFLSWLAARHTMIGGCRQSDLDQWLAEGPSTRHQVETFISWASAKKLSPKLTTGAWPARSSPLITQDERLRWIADCLTGEPDTLAYRVVVMLVLLYAQPLVRVAALRVQDIDVARTETRIRLGPKPAPVPEPFAAMLRAHLASRPNLRTINNADNPWLFPGTRAGRHLHPATITDRLGELGINMLGARNAALRALVRQVPAPIVATQLGYSPQTTLRHAALAAEAMSRYAAHRARILAGTSQA